MSGGFIKTGALIHAVVGKLPVSRFAGPQAVAVDALGAGNHLQEIQIPQSGALPVLAVKAFPVVSSLTDMLPPGGAKVYRFEYSDATFQERFVFATSPAMTASAATADFPCVMDIMEDTDEGEVVLVNTLVPQRMATSYNSRFDQGESEYGLNYPPHLQGLANQGGPSSAPGSVFWGFCPQDYTYVGSTSPRGTGFYRLRVRGRPNRHPWFGYPVGLGGTFTLEYTSMARDLRYRIKMYDDTPIAGKAVEFEVTKYGTAAPFGVFFEWDFDEGGGWVAGGVAMTYTFATAGPKTVKCKIDNGGSAEAIIERQVTVGASTLPTTNKGFVFAKEP